MSDSTNRQWRFYIRDMLAFAEKVIRYTSELNQESFVNSGLNDDATLRNLELIGEAATHIPVTFRVKKSTNRMEVNHRYKKSSYPRVSGYRHRYHMEHYSRRYTGTHFSAPRFGADPSELRLI